VVEQRRAEPQLRIGLVVDADVVRVRGQGAVTVRGATTFELSPDEEVRVTSSDGGVHVEGHGGGSRRLTVESRDPTLFLVVNGRTYRGAVEVLSNGFTVTAVNVIGTSVTSSLLSKLKRLRPERMR
jgi:hypothetical protein